MGRDELPPARHARLAPAAIHLQLELKPTRLAHAGPIVPDRGPRGVHRALEDIGYGGMQPGELFERQLVRRLRGIDPRLEQRLIRVDVAHASHSSLIHDRFLDRGARARQALGEDERRERLLQRLRADPACVGGPRRVVQQPYGPQAAHIPVHEEPAVLPGAGEDRVLRLVLGESAIVHDQRPGHARLYHEPVTARQAEHGVFGPASDFLEGVPCQCLEEAGLRNATQDVRLGQPGAGDPEPLEPRGQLPHDRLNLGQLRHAPFPARSPPADLPPPTPSTLAPRWARLLQGCNTGFRCMPPPALLPPRPPPPAAPPALPPPALPPPDVPAVGLALEADQLAPASAPLARLGDGVPHAGNGEDTPAAHPERAVRRAGGARLEYERPGLEIA